MTPNTTPSAPAVRKTWMIALGSVVALAALFFLVVDPLLLSADVAPETGAAPASTGPADVAPPAPVATPEPVLAEPVPESFEIYSVRDPFQQLVEIAPLPGTAPTTASTTSTPADGTTAAGTTATASTTSSTTAGTAANGTTPVGATTVSLRDVLGEGEEPLTAQVVVNGNGFEAREGDAFADSFRVLALSGKCGTFLFGEEQFTLCQGEEIRK